MITFVMRMEDLTTSLKYQQWIKALQENGIAMLSTEELSVVHKPDGQVLFALVRTDAVAPNGQKLLPISLIRGHFVGVLMSLNDTDSGAEYFLMVRQRRIATGGTMLEHPAGMMDATRDPFEVAVNEVKEETGVDIQGSDLILLNEKVLYSSPGLLDEGGYFFAVRLNLSSSEIQALDDKAEGHGSEGEFIQTVVLSREAAMNETTVSNALLHFYLWEDYKRANHLS